VAQSSGYVFAVDPRATLLLLAGDQPKRERQAHVRCGDKAAA
jgi:hypothetical protein